jgi:hypothetical protein
MINFFDLYNLEVKMIKNIIKVLLMMPILISAQTIFFSSDFEGNPPLYNWEGLHNYHGDVWSVVNLPDGGWNGSQAAMIVAEQGQTQYNIGWYNFSHSQENFPSEWNQGDDFYVRFRVRFPEEMRWDGTGSQQNKLFVWGSGTYGGTNHRVMIMQEAHHTTSPCCNMEQNYRNSNYGLFSVKRNISENCTPYVPVTYGQWYHIQVYVKSSTSADATNAEFKIWLNNNDFENPNSSVTNFNLAVNGIWDQGFTFGGFWTDVNSNRDYQIIFDDFQMADFFDSNWMVGSNESNPENPQNPRITP